MSEKGKLIRNHPLSAGRWEASDGLQDLTPRDLRAPEDSSPPDEDPPGGVSFDGIADCFVEYDDGDGGGAPDVVCVDCVHYYDSRPLWRLWLDRVLRRTAPARTLFCAAAPREDTYSPVTGELVYVNSMFSTPSQGLKEPDERCQDINLWGNCPLFEEPE